MNLGLMMLAIGVLAAVFAIWLAWGLQNIRAATHWARGVRARAEPIQNEHERRRGP